MSPEEFQEGEPLIEGLEEIPSESFAPPPPPGGLRERLFEQTARRVRSRPRRRKIILGACVLGAYLAGAATVHILEATGRWGLPDGSRDLAGTFEPPPRSPSPTGAKESPESVGLLLAALPPDPSRLERRLSGQPQEERRRLLEEAGNLYLAEAGDVAKALYCYRKVLQNEESDATRNRDRGESWLLSVLRHARELEKIHENADS